MAKVLTGMLFATVNTKVQYVGKYGPKWKDEYFPF